MVENKQKVAKMRIISWNVNGIRAIVRKNFFRVLEDSKPEIIGIQETKTNKVLPLKTNYEEYWSLGERAGYAGTLSLVKSVAVKRRELPDILSAEGRAVLLELEEFFLLNVYFPNGGMGPERLAYKMNYYQKFLQFVKELEKEKPVIFMGDVNTAHQEIDLARPKENSKNTGFLPQERAWLDEIVNSGLTDVWREFHPKEVGYSWWDYKTKARERNVGWRIDYFFCSKSLLPKISKCEILSEIMGSDHAPILLEIY